LKTKFEDQQRLFILTTIFIILNILFFVLAMLFYPDYNQVEQTLSKLVTKWPAAGFFNIAIIFGILSAMLVAYILNKELQKITNVRNSHRLFITTIFTLIPLFMFGVLLFPSMGETSDIHDLIAVLLFIFMGIGTFTTSYISEHNIEGWNKLITYLGYIIPILVVILGYLLSFGEYGPVVQKITVLLFDAWCLLTISGLFKQEFPSKIHD